MGSGRGRFRLSDRFARRCLEGGVFGVLALDLRDLRPDLGPGEGLELVCPVESFELDCYRRAEFEL